MFAQNGSELLVWLLLEDESAVKLERRGIDSLSFSANRTYRLDIDGVRAIAVLGVVLYHAGVPFLCGGFSGVDIFFVISGYLIGGHIFAEVCAGKFSYKEFYKRRAKRILPAFYLVLSFTTFAALVMLSPAEAHEYAKVAIAAVLSASNVYFAHSSNYFQTKSQLYPLLMTWSLGVEEQFYLVIPPMMVVVTRFRRWALLPVILIVSGASLIIAVHALSRNPDAVFYSLPTRAWELGVGVALGVAELDWGRPRSTTWSQAAGALGCLLMLMPMHLLTVATPFPGLAAIPSVVGCALVLSAPGGFINRRVLSWQPLVAIGKISYSWYLWHWPLLAFLRLASGGTVPTAVTACAVAVSLGLAVLTYKYVEQPYRRSTRAAGPLLLRYVAVSCAYLTISGALLLSHGFPGRFPAIAQQGDTESHTCLVSYGGESPDVRSYCYPATDPRPSVVLWGDSHAAALAPALRQMAKSKGYSFTQLTKASCLPLTGLAKVVPQHPMAASECVHFNDAALRLIAADRHIRVVVMAGRWADPFRGDGKIYPLRSLDSKSQVLWPFDTAQTRFVQSLTDSIEKVKAGGREVILFDDVPLFNFDPWLRFQTVHIPVRLDVANWLQANTEIPGAAQADFVSAGTLTSGLLHKAVEQVPGVALVNLKALFCNQDNLCKYMEGDRMLYLDEQHLTAAGAQYALRQFRLPTAR